MFLLSASTFTLAVRRSIGCSLLLPGLLWRLVVVIGRKDDDVRVVDSYTRWACPDDTSPRYVSIFQNFGVPEPETVAQQVLLIPLLNRYLHRLIMNVFTLQRLKHKCGRDNVDTLISMRIYI